MRIINYKIPKSYRQLRVGEIIPSHYHLFDRHEAFQLLIPSINNLYSLWHRERLGKRTLSLRILLIKK